MMQTGRFITLDGSEGAGKSTQLQRIHRWLQEQNIDVWCTREPGGTPVGEQIRTLLLDPNNHISSDAELLLIMAARRQHLDHEILPRLARGQWVICDRFNDATYAYQGYGRGIDLTRIASLEHWVMPHFKPDLRIILGVSAATARTRLVARGGIQDRFEQEQQPFYDRIATGYRERAQSANACWIDADQSTDNVFHAICQHLTALL